MSFCPINSKRGQLAIVLTLFVSTIAVAQSSTQPNHFGTAPFGQPTTVASPPQFQPGNNPFQQSVNQVVNEANRAVDSANRTINQTNVALNRAVEEVAQLPTFDNPTMPTPMPTAAPVTPEPTSAEPKSAEEMAGEAGQKAAEEVARAKNVIMAALQGDQVARKYVLEAYLWPLLKLILILIAANWISARIGRGVTTIVSKRVDETLGRFAGKFARFAVMFVVFAAFYGSYLSVLGTVIAALGFAIAMAFQGTLGNFASGVALLVFRPFKVGDYIMVDGEEGTVNEIELFTTTIDTPDNRHIIVPNGSVFGNKIQNWSHNSLRRADVLVGVSYTADMKKTRQVLTAALQNIPGAATSKAPQVYLCELNASSVDWSCRVWCTPAEYLAVKERVTEAVKVALDQHGIGIPFPQLDLHVITANQKRLAA